MPFGFQKTVGSYAQVIVKGIVVGGRKNVAGVVKQGSDERHSVVSFRLFFPKESPSTGGSVSATWPCGDALGCDPWVPKHLRKRGGDAPALT